MELFKVDFGLTIWMFVAFAILLFILWKFAWPAILKGVDSRADLIDKGVEYAQNAKIRLDNAQQEARQYVADARHQQADIIAEANKMKTQIIDEAKVEASKEAQKVMDAAKVSIQQSQKEAELQLKNEVSKFALDIAEKVMRKEMKSDKAQSELVNKLLDEYENN